MLFVIALMSYMVNEPLIEATLVYACPEKQAIYSLSLRPGTTLSHALVHSGVLTDYPELSLNSLCVGIWGKITPLETEVHPHDRIEIYRPLRLDPKKARQEKVLRERKKARMATSLKIL